MVQWQFRPLSTSGKDLADNDYWKLKMPRPAGIIMSDDTADEADEADLAEDLPAHRHFAIQIRKQRGMLIYDNCNDVELRQFCQQRGIRLLRSSASREGMIACLEGADDEGTTFGKFLDLPTELQLRIYDCYKSSLGDGFGPFSVAPPITAVSKIVRHDAASVFFRDRMFICSLDTTGPYMEELTRVFFDKAPLCFLEQVRRLEIMATLPDSATAVTRYTRPDATEILLRGSGSGYAEWLVDLRAKNREDRVVFEGVGTYSQPGQTPIDRDRIISAVREALRDVVDGIVSRDRLALRREDAKAILSALETLP